jgi:hypothetical protein
MTENPVMRYSDTQITPIHIHQVNKIIHLILLTPDVKTWSLNSSIIVFDTVMSLNMPSNFEVN